jgi:threonine dehydrogenase-like Zn-dependent dehydrogenase
MRATLLYQAGDVRVEDVAEPKIQQPTDAVVRIVVGCVCGSDLWDIQANRIRVRVSLLTPRRIRTRRYRPGCRGRSGRRSP